MEELKKCPFCGGYATVEKLDVGEIVYRVPCRICPVATLWFNTEGDAIAAWNRRATQNIGKKECSVQEGRCTFDE